MVAVTRAQEVQKEPRERKASVALMVSMARRVNKDIMGYQGAKDLQDSMACKDLLDQKGTLVLMDPKESRENLELMEDQAGVEMLDCLEKRVSLEV